LGYFIVKNDKQMINRQVKYRHVQCFVVICQERSFKLAAEKLFLTQPAISRTIKELEDIVGQKLLVRDRGGVSLTPSGETFLHFARMSLASLQQGLDGLTLGGGAPQRSLSIGVLPSVAARLIPKVADAFSAATPDVVLRISDGPHGYLVDRLKLGALDLVIGRMGGHDQMKGVTFATLYREPVCMVVRVGHPLLADARLENLRNWPVVYPAEGSAIRPFVERFLIEQGIGHVPRRIETVSGAFGRIYVQNSDAVWFISEGVVTNEIEKGLLVKLPISMEATLGPIGIMARDDWDFTSEARSFRRLLQDTIAAAPNLVA
jgi:LysR family pca operon transcriptional activator